MARYRVMSFLTLLSLGTSLVSSSIADENDGFTAVDSYGDTTLRYKEVPTGICELQHNVTSYSGYVDIPDTGHMFFWFFEARNQDPKTAPLTAWISGGPGDSSMAELFTEHGPCRIEPDNKTVVFNPFSWNNYSNIIYIDQPVHVGFSYTDLVPACLCEDNYDDNSNLVPLSDGPCAKNQTTGQCGNFSTPDPGTTANSTENAAPTFWTVLQSFMTVFPEYSQNGFHFGSESYGGHYVPVFSDYILKQNEKNISGTVQIDLQSILIGNGWSSPEIQYASYYSYAFDPGTPYNLDDIANVNDSVKQDVYEGMYGDDGCLARLKQCQSSGSNDDCADADEYCADNVQQPWQNDSGLDNNDVREQDPSPFPNEFYSGYLQIPRVRDAIGAQQTYIEANPTVGIAFYLTADNARELGILDIFGDLVRRGIRVTLFAGDSDYECNWLGVEAVANAVQAPGYNTAGYMNVSTPDCITHGQVKQSGLFSFVRVYQAGHAVGAFQPLMQQTIFQRTISGVDIATGKSTATSSYKTSGPLNSTYQEGNATVQTQPVPSDATYNYTSNEPSLEDFQPTWNPSLVCSVADDAATSEACRVRIVPRVFSRLGL